jgi:hypothetical protein
MVTWQSCARQGSASFRPARLNEEQLLEESALSVSTLAELQVGVLAARDTATRAARLATSN